MNKSHLCDILVSICGIALLVAWILVPDAYADLMLYAGVAVLGLYTYVCFEVLPRAEARRAKAEEIAVADGKVLRLPLLSESENHRGKHVKNRRRAVPLARAVGR